MTDEELEAQIADFVKPFTFDRKPFLRCRITKTPNHKFVLLYIYHIVCDCYSEVQLISDIVTALKGGHLELDNTFEILHEEAEYRESELFAAISTKSAKGKHGVLFLNKSMLLMKIRFGNITRNFITRNLLPLGLA